MMNQNYRICLRHMGKEDNTFLLWGYNSNGYSRSIEDAGYYEENNTSSDDPIISKAIVDKYRQKVILPQYGDRKETYSDRNEFYVLPNTGQVRRALGITKLDIKLEGSRNSFPAYFKDEYIEKFKWVYSKTHFRIRAKKDVVSEWWYYDEIIKAENRNKAISTIYRRDYDWEIADSFIEFKSMVTCSRTRVKVLDKWERL